MVGACEVDTVLLCECSFQPSVDVLMCVCSSSVIWSSICRKTDLNRYLVHRYDSQKLAHIQL